MAKTHQYKLSKYGHTYVLTATPPKPTTQKETNPHVHLNQCVSLCLVYPIQPDNTTHPVPQAMAPLLENLLMSSNHPLDYPPLPHRSFYKSHSRSFITQCPFLPTSTTRGRGNRETIDEAHKLRSYTTFLFPLCIPCLCNPKEGHH
jgi:hypothetical protein